MESWKTGRLLLDVDTLPDTFLLCFWEDIQLGANPEEQIKIGWFSAYFSPKLIPLRGWHVQTMSVTENLFQRLVPATSRPSPTCFRTSDPLPVCNFAPAPGTPGTAPAAGADNRSIGGDVVASDPLPVCNFAPAPSTPGTTPAAGADNRSIGGDVAARTEPGGSRQGATGTEEPPPARDVSSTPDAAAAGCFSLYTFTALDRSVRYSISPCLRMTIH